MIYVGLLCISVSDCGLLLSDCLCVACYGTLADRHPWVCCRCERKMNEAVSIERETDRDRDRETERER